MDRFRKLTEDRLREQLMQKVAAPPPRYVAPPATYQKLLQPAPALRQPSPSLQRQLQVAPPSISERVAANIGRLQAPPPISFSERMMQTEQQPPAEQEAEPWVIWQSPDGTDVAVPESYGAPEGWTQIGTIDDPEAIQRAQESPIGFDNQAEEVQDLFTVPGEREIANDGQNILWMGDDLARQQQELEDIAQSTAAVTEQERRRLLRERLWQQSTPISIDLARQAEEERAANPSLVQQANRLRQKLGMTEEAGYGIPIGIDISRQEAEEAAQQQSAEYQNQQAADRLARKQAANFPASYNATAPPEPIQLGTPDGFIWITTPDNPQPHLHPIDQQLPVIYEPVYDPPMSNEVSAYDLGIALATGAAQEPDRVAQQDALREGLRYNREQAAQEQEAYTQRVESIRQKREDEQRDGPLNLADVTVIDGHYYPAGTENPEDLEYTRPNNHNLPPAPEGWMWVYDVQAASTGEGQPYLVPAGAPPAGTAVLQLVPSEDDQGGMLEPIADFLKNPIETGMKADILARLWDLIPDDAQEFIKFGLNITPDLLRESLDAVKSGDLGSVPEAIYDLLDKLFTTPITYSGLIPGVDDDVSLADAAGAALDPVMSVGEALIHLISIPQQYSAEQGIEAWYANATGTDRDAPIWDDLLAGGELLLFQITEMGPWLKENEALAIQVYENGVDIDGDGTVDLTGAEAVLWTYNEEASAWDAFMFAVATDPLTWIPIIGAAGKGIKGAGLALQTARRGRVARNIGRGLEAVGEGVYRGSRIAEDAADLGLGYAPDVLRIAGRRLPGVRRLTAPSNRFKRTMAEEGFDEASTATRSGLRSTDAPADVIIDPETGVIEGVTLPGRGVVSLEPEHADELARQLDPNLAIADAARTPAERAALQTAYNDLQAAGIDPSQVPPRFLEPIDSILRANPGNLDQIRDGVRNGLPEMRQHVIRMDAGFGRGRSFPDAALDTSGWTRDTFRPLFGAGIDFPEFRLSTPRQSRTHVLAETVIHQPWDSAASRDARSRLYRNVGANDAIRKPLGVNPSDARIAQAERYANLVDEHLAWNPALIDDPSFARVLDEADAIRRQLADIGIRPRKRYELRVAPSRDVKQAATPAAATPDPADAAADRVEYDPIANDVAVPAHKQRLVDEGIATEADLFDNTATLYRWSEADYADAVDTLALIRQATGARTITRADVFTPTGRRWLNDLNTLLDKRRTLARHNANAARNPSTGKIARQARKQAEAMQGQITTLERRLGVVEGSGQKRIATSKSIIPDETSRLAKQYARDVERLTTIRHERRSWWHARNQDRMSLVADEGGMAYVVSPWGDMVLTNEHLAQMTKYTFANGDTTLDRWMKHMNARYGSRTLAPDDAIEAARLQTLDELTEHLKTVYPTRQASVFGRAWDTYTTFLRNAILSTWYSIVRYTSNTFGGNTLNLAFGGYGTGAWRMFQLRQILANTKAVNTMARVVDADRIALDPFVLKSERLADAYGFTPPPEIKRQIRTDNVVSERSNTDKVFDKAMGKWFDPMTKAGERGADDLRREAMRQLQRAGKDRATATQIVDEFLATYKYGFDPKELHRYFRKHLPSPPTLPVNVARKLTQGLFTGDSVGMRLNLAGDIQMRDIVFDIAFNREMKMVMRDFNVAAGTRLRAAGFTDAEVTDILRRFHDAHPKGFKMADVQADFRDHLPEGMADRLGRDWQSAVNRTRNGARAEVSRVGLAGTETNLDVAVRRWLMFSYFTSRQYMFLIRQGLRHPGLINAYMAYQDLVERYIEENPDLPRWMKGLFRITAGDLALVFNPMALWQMGNMFPTGESVPTPPEGHIWITNGEENQLLAEDEPIPDGWEEGYRDDRNIFERLIENEWVFVHPGIANILNITGFLGDRRDVDPFNTHVLGRHIQFAQNIGRLAGLIDDTDLAGNPSDDFWNQMRQSFSGKFGWVPGNEHVQFIESAESENAELRAIAWDEARQMGLDPENNVAHRQWIEDQMDDPTSELYRDSLKRYLLGEGAELAARMTPGLAALRPMVRQQDLANKDLMESIKDEANREMKQFVRSPDPQGRAMQNSLDAFHEIGEGELGGMADDFYTEIVYGTPNHSVVVDGVEYTPDDIMAMSEEERKALALAFFAEMEGEDGSMLDAWREVQDEQNLFLADPQNAEYAQYRQWSGAVRDYDGGIEAYWQDVIQGNPNARRYYESLDPDMTDEERERALTSTWAFMAVAGIQQYVYQPEPLETNYFDPVDVANHAPQPTPYEPYVSEWEQGTTEQVTKYEREMKRAQPVIDQILTDYGYPPGTPLNTIPYRTRFDIMDEYERRTGDRIPYEQSESYYLANEYFMWADQQPEGADTSLDAYFVWSEEQYDARRGETFTADQQAKDDPRTAYEVYDENRSKDPGYRWEDEDD